MDRRGLLAGFLALAATPAVAQGTRASPFAPQVDYAIDGRFGTGQAPGRLWRTRQAIRYESREGIERHLIARLDRDKLWLSLPGLGVTFESDLTGFGLPPAALRGGGFVHRAMGRETVDGQALDKVRLTRTRPDPSFDGFAWVDGRGVLWRLQGAGEAGGVPGNLDWHFANAVVGPVRADLMEAPPGRIVPMAGEALMAALRRFGLIR